jgi:outer membrane protein assembly factor BamB
MNRFFSACLLGLAAFAPTYADNWPQWRGPTNDGICLETNLPAEWSETNNVIWKVPLPGQGASTPIIWDKRLFLTSQDGKDLVLMCFSTDGKELWKRKLGTGQARYMGGEANMASSTPCTDGKHVWAYAGTGDFACFDLDGTEVWRFNAQERYGKFQILFGMHTTPLLDGDRLYFQLLHSGAWLVMALDKATGQPLWKIDRSSDASAENEQAYTSPVLWRRGQEEYLIVHGNDYATAHRLTDGREIWRVGDLNPDNAQHKYRRDLRFVASPLATPDVIVIPSAKQHDVVGIKPTARGLVGAGSRYELWRRPKGTPDVSSPLAYDGLLYLAGESGLLTCLDLKTGKEMYPPQRLHAARYRASPIYADGKIYLTARDGVITVLKAGPKFERIAENKLPDEISASLAVSNGRIYIRGWTTLYAIGKDYSEPAASRPEAWLTGRLRGIPPALLFGAWFRWRAARKRLCCLPRSTARAVLPLRDTAPVP